MDPVTTVMQALATNENAGLVMDFDGVLSLITDDPDASELLPGTEQILAGLATRPEFVKSNETWLLVLMSSWLGVFCWVVDRRFLR